MKRFLNPRLIRFYSTNITTYNNGSIAHNNKLNTCSSNLIYIANGSQYKSTNINGTRAKHLFEKYNVTFVSEYTDKDDHNVIAFEDDHNVIAFESTNTSDTNNKSPIHNKQMQSVIYDDILKEIYEHFKKNYEFFNDTTFYPTTQNYLETINESNLYAFWFGPPVVPLPYLTYIYEIIQKSKEGLKFHYGNILSHVLAMNWERKNITNVKSLHVTKWDNITVTKNQTFVFTGVCHDPSRISTDFSNTHDIEIFQTKSENISHEKMEKVYKILGINKNSSPYEILGIPKTDDKKIIKSAYIKLAFKYHPDINSQYKDVNVFTVINQAYHNLIL